MALLCDVVFNKLNVPNAYIKIERLFGSKKENWGCVVSFSVDKESADKGEHFDTKNFNAEYVPGELAYITLYKALKEKLYPEAIDVTETEESAV